MSLTASGVPVGGSSAVVMKTPPSGWSSPAKTRISARSLQPGAGRLAVDHLAEQLLDLAVACDLHVPSLIGIPPVIQLAPLSELVEVRAWHRELQACTVGLPFGDDRAGHADTEDLHVTPPTQLEANRELQVAERRDHGGEAPVGGRDQLLGASHLGAVALEELSSDHHLLDLGRALPDQEQGRVAVDALDLVLLGIAVSAVDPEGLLGVRLRRL